jgi:hypothetical protein
VTKFFLDRVLKPVERAENDAPQTSIFNRYEALAGILSAVDGSSLEKWVLHSEKALKVWERFSRVPLSLRQEVSR